MDPGASVDAQTAPPLLPPPAPPHTSPFAPPSLPPPPVMQPPRLAGQLSPLWRLAFGFAWAATVAGQVVIWETSRVIGLSTWWLGADAEPRSVFFQLLPFYGPLMTMVAAISNWRYAPYTGIVVAVLGAAIGVGDLNRVRWIAVVELTLAGGALCVSVASLAGMYRRVVEREAIS